MEINSIQDLFERWISTEQGCIWEYSTNITEDIQEVKIAAKVFAEKYELICKDEWFD